jgi:hypothetical protein
MTTALEGWWVVSSTPRPYFTRYPLYRRLAGPQGRSGQMRKISTPTGIRSPDRPARSSVAVPTELPGPRSPNVQGYFSLSKVGRNLKNGQSDISWCRMSNISSIGWHSPTRLGCQNPSATLRNVRLKAENDTICPERTPTCFKYFSEPTTTMSLYNSRRWACVMNMYCVEI